jgi:dihydroorotase-like cyclic amidohydrolase
VDGTVEVIATDHAPHAGSEKMQEFERCHSASLAWKQPSASRSNNSFTWQNHPQKDGWLTTGPARVLGRCAAGRSPRRRRRRNNLRHVGAVDLMSIRHSQKQNSPFHGHTTGGPVATIVNGAIVWRR